MKNLILSALLFTAVAATAAEPRKHDFWDNANRTIFISAVAAQTYDATTTRYALDNYEGSREGNVFARPFENQGSAGTIAFHYGVMTGGPLLVSYWLHRTGHYRLERLPMFFSIGMGMQGGIHNSRQMGR